MTVELHPLEQLAFDTARQEMRLGYAPGVMGMLVMALERLTGGRDWVQDKAEGRL